MSEEAYSVYTNGWCAMCGRFEQDPSVKQIRDLLDSLEENGNRIAYKTGEIFPTYTSVVLIKGLEPVPMIWGFPKWDGKGVVFNARAETALERPMFRKPLQNNPLVVPTTGFYEWKANPERRKKDRYLFHEPGAPVTWLAGFFNTFSNEGRTEQRFTILTTDANDGMRDYHDRMPVVLHEDERESWLGGQLLPFFLEREPFALEARRAD